MTEKYTRVAKKISMDNLVAQAKSWEHMKALERIANLFGVLK